MKILNSFVLNKEVEVDGKPVEKPVTFTLVEPTRTQRDEADLFYNVKLSSAIKAGMLTRQQLQRRIIDDGGLLSEAEIAEYEKMVNRFRVLRDEYQRLSLIKDPEKTEPQKKRFSVVSAQITECRREIQDFETNRSELFDHTSEVWARNKLFAWWLIHLGFVQEEGDKEPRRIFVKDTYNDNLDEYDVLALDDLYGAALEKLLLHVTIWQLIGATKPEEFDTIEKEFIK